MKIDSEVLFDAIELDGVNYELLKTIIIEKRHKTVCITQTLSGVRIDLSFVQSNLTGWKKSFAKIRHFFGWYSNPEIKNIILYLKEKKIIK